MSGGGGGGGGDWRPEPTPIKPKKPTSGGGAGGGSGGGSGGGDGGGEPDPCDISELTNLNSVNAAVLATLRVGDVLTVVYQPGPPARLVAVAASGATVGSITSPSMAQIILCITRGGHSYEATIVAIRGGICQVEISRV